MGFIKAIGASASSQLHDIYREVIAPEEIRKSMYERANIKMKATSVDEKEADIYTKLSTSIMGMNLGNTVAGVINKEIDK